jgi:hypothetical protein
MGLLRVEVVAEITTRTDSCRLVLAVDMEVEGRSLLLLLHHRGRLMNQNLVAVDMSLHLRDKGCPVDLLRGGEVLDCQVVHEARDFRLI